MQNIIKRRGFLLPIRLGITLLLVSRFLSIQHLPGHEELSESSCALIAIFYFLRYRAKTKRDVMDHFRLFLVMFWTLPALFMPMIPGISDSVAAGISGLQMITFAYSAYEYSFGQKKGLRILSGAARYIVAGGISAYIVAVMFKIMHWPASGMLFALGFLSIITGLWVDAFRQNPASSYRFRM
ncbi:MAG: hypothetical protein H6585_07685 [Flavobacteriales bacterium]|nr:hypothetical protein [Flavobacteriales bacterium]MCB9448207.1 hypothetical protein [Flavobacteriales bacterium]